MFVKEAVLLSPRLQPSGSHGVFVGSRSFVFESFVRGLVFVRAVRSCDIVGPLPFVQFGFEIDVTFIAQALIEFLLIGPMGARHFRGELWCPAFDVAMPDTFVLYMPIEFGLELVAVASGCLDLWRNALATQFELRECGTEPSQ